MINYKNVPNDIRAFFYYYYWIVTKLFEDKLGQTLVWCKLYSIEILYSFLSILVSMKKENESNIIQMFSTMSQIINRTSRQPSNKQKC